MHNQRTWLVLAVGLAAVVFVVLLGHPGSQPASAGQSPLVAPTSGPIVVTSSDQTLDGVVIVSSLSTGIGIKAWGTATRPIRNLTIRNCTIRGFNTAIDVRFVTNLKIENCTIADASYAGILVFSGIDGLISGNRVDRIGVGIDTTGPDSNNAYGIALTRTATTDFETDPRTSNFVVDGNDVEDVPLWHGLDTHAGLDITFSNNTVARCARPIFITGDSLGNHPEDVTVTGNRLESAADAPGGTNVAAITLVNLQTGSITNNAVSTSYGTPIVYDYLGLDPAGSTNVTVSGQTAIP